MRAPVFGPVDIAVHWFFCEAGVGAGSEESLRNNVPIVSKVTEDFI